MWTRNGTYWRMLAFSFLHISFIGTYWDNCFGGSIKFFHIKIAPGLALGKSWPLLAQPQRNTDVNRQTCINRNKLLKKLGTNAMVLIQAITTVPRRLPFCAQLTNCNVGPCGHVMAHIGAEKHSCPEKNFAPFFDVILRWENW